MEYEILSKNQLVDLLIKRDEEITRLSERIKIIKDKKQKLLKKNKKNKKHENQLIKEISILRGLLEATEDSVFVISQGEVLYKNKNLVEMFQLPETIKSDEDVLISNLGAQVTRSEFFVSEVKKIESEHKIYKDTISLKDGRVINQRYYPLNLGNDKKGGIWCYREITDQENKKILNDLDLNHKKFNQSSYNDLQSQFFSFVSHEFKSPVNIMMGAVQLISKTLDLEVNCSNKESIKQYIEILKRNSYRLLRLINNFIDINKISSGFLTLECEICNIIEVVEELIQSVKVYASNKDLVINFYSEVKYLLVWCDVEKIERIILNIFSNAIKYTESGGKIDVQLYVKKKKVYLSIKDTGIGIPENNIESIFDPFSKVQAEFRNNAEGNGLGLAIVKALLELHGGKISCKSQYGKGSEFIVELPILKIPKTNKKTKRLRFHSKDMIDLEIANIRGMCKIDKG